MSPGSIETKRVDDAPLPAYIVDLVYFVWANKKNSGTVKAINTHDGGNTRKQIRQTRTVALPRKASILPESPSSLLAVTAAMPRARFYNQ